MTRRVAVLGATGTIGRAVVAELTARGEAVVPVVRPGREATLPGARTADVTDAAALTALFAAERIDAVVCCLASRTGVPAEAAAIDRDAAIGAIRAAEAAGVGTFVLLSALCVQKPRLAFQRAKLAAEAALQASALDWTIVRPTAFFKSLSGQVERVRAGKPFPVFGDGRLTATKPVSDPDLAAFIADCLGNPERRHRILPIGGPGPARTPREQGEALFRLAGRPPRFTSVPPQLLSGIAAGLGATARLVPAMAAKAELARIGHYYATESMLVLTPHGYDAAATPETGSDTLDQHFAGLLAGTAADDRGTHAVF